MGQLEQPKFKRVEHPAHSPDLALCDFLLFEYIKEQLKGRGFAEEEEFLWLPSELMSEIPPDMILRVFADWHRRLWLCVLMEWQYGEQSFNLLWLLTGLDKRTLRVRVLDAHPGRLISKSVRRDNRHEEP
jgi:hypothetical protein